MSKTLLVVGGDVGKVRYDDIGVKLAHSKASRPRLAQIVIAYGGRLRHRTF
ncbi:hypothetical protein [Nostoc sp. UHCC 0252]|uniref:hypothetical protein n=1 Tax=Nostoc sp. UHCC 0252 TaxID=3110241 RepID=UPI002B204D08|nr:hypothetical protein [Nostoc sp. UHCC 0252]MEA5605447.1 hypothetical protein [Nostoc sp. UHCC 0252]